MIIHLLVFIFGFISSKILLEIIKKPKIRDIKVEKVICNDCFDFTLLLSPSIIPKDKNIIVRHNLSLHTIDRKSVGNIKKPRGRDVLFEKYCPENETEDNTLIVASPLNLTKVGEYRIEKGVKLIFRRQCNYYLGEVAKDISISEWRSKTEGPNIKIPIIIAGQVHDIKLYSIVAQAKEAFADWHYE